MCIRDSPNGGYNVSARTSFGRISSAYPISTMNASSESIVGSINGGGCKLDLTTANGNISIEKE